MQAQKHLTADRDAALGAAQAAVQRLQKQLETDASAGTSMREAQAESESIRQQLEESMRKYSTVKQARERAMSEVCLDTSAIAEAFGCSRVSSQGSLMWHVYAIWYYMDHEPVLRQSSVQA